MLTLRKIALIGASALAMSSVSAVSQAQPWGYARPAYDVGRLNSSYVDSLDWKITNAAQRGVISWPEARDLRNQLRSVQNYAYRVQTRQASEWEYRRLNNVVTRIEAATTRYAANDRYDRYGRGRVYDGYRR